MEELCGVLLGEGCNVGGRNEPQPGEPWAGCSCTWNLLSLCRSWVRIPIKLRPRGHRNSEVGGSGPR